MNHDFRIVGSLVPTDGKYGTHSVAKTWRSAGELDGKEVRDDVVGRGSLHLDEREWNIDSESWNLRKILKKGEKDQNSTLELWLTSLREKESEFYMELYMKLWDEGRERVVWEGTWYLCIDWHMNNYLRSPTKMCCRSVPLGRRLKRGWTSNGVLSVDIWLTLTLPWSVVRFTCCWVLLGTFFCTSGHRTQWDRTKSMIHRGKIKNK